MARHDEKHRTNLSTAAKRRWDNLSDQAKAEMVERMAAANRRKRLTVEDFWARVDRSGGDDACWPWVGPRDRDGYGKATLDSWPRRAHRVAYELTIGPIPDGMTLDHVVCDNPPCCNPKHLQPATAADNRRRGRYPNREKTHCKHGHEFTPANTYVNAAGHRYCRACRNEACRRIHARKVARRRGTPSE